MKDLIKWQQNTFPWRKQPDDDEKKVKKAGKAGKAEKTKEKKTKKKS